MDITNTINEIFNEFDGYTINDLTIARIQDYINSKLNHLRIMRSCPLYAGRHVNYVLVRIQRELQRDNTEKYIHMYLEIIFHDGDESIKIIL